MKTVFQRLTLASLILASAGSAFAGVTVKFVQPEQFSDLPFAAYERKEVLDELTKHFEQLAKQLPAGVDLNVEVLDVDLAGRIHHRRADEIRVMRGGADWPTMHLRYSLVRDGKVIASGSERLSDMMYLDTLRGRYSSGEQLRYEKQMIDEWFNKEILTKHVG